MTMRMSGQAMHTPTVRVARKHGEWEVVVDGLHHYYPGADLDTEYLESAIGASGYDYRQAVVILRRVETFGDSLDEDSLDEDSLDEDSLDED